MYAPQGIVGDAIKIEECRRNLEKRKKELQLKGQFTEEEKNELNSIDMSLNSSESFEFLP